MKKENNINILEVGDNVYCEDRYCETLTKHKVYRTTKCFAFLGNKDTETKIPISSENNYVSVRYDSWFRIYYSFENEEFIKKYHNQQIEKKAKSWYSSLKTSEIVNLYLNNNNETTNNNNNPA
jgi:hypothetical protein